MDIITDGLKHDGGKMRLDLVPPEMIEAVGAVMTHGAEKYGDLGAERKDDEVFWTHIDRKLEQIGLDFPKEDYEVMDI